MPKTSAHAAFAAALKQLCNARGLSQADLRRGTGIDEGLISKYLRGYSVPTEDRVRDIADYFGVDRETLERLAGYRANSTSIAQLDADGLALDAELARLRDLVKGVPPAYRTAILRTMYLAGEAVSYVLMSEAQKAQTLD